MKIRHWVVCVLAAVVTALAGCSASSSNESDDNGSVADSSTSEGNAIDVRGELIGQGFSKRQLMPIETNAGYWLLPFNTPLDMSLDEANTKSSCKFVMINATYPGKGAYKDYPIKSNSVVAIQAHVIKPDGSLGEKLPEVVEMKLSEVTPKRLATDSGFDLSRCEDTELR